MPYVLHLQDSYKQLMHCSCLQVICHSPGQCDLLVNVTSCLHIDEGFYRQKRRIHLARIYTGTSGDLPAIWSDTYQTPRVGNEYPMNWSDCPDLAQWPILGGQTRLGFCDVSRWWYWSRYWFLMPHFSADRTVWNRWIMRGVIVGTMAVRRLGMTFQFIEW